MTYTENPKIPEELVRRIGNSRINLYYIVPELDNKLVFALKLGTELKLIGMNSQIWYDRHALGIDDSSDRPKCPYCGKERAWISIYAGYRPTCGSKECKSKEYTRVQNKSRSVNSDRWNKQCETIGSSTQELSKAWKDYGKDSGLTYHQFAANFWKEWREKNNRLSIAEFKSTRHENMLKRMEEKKRRWEESKSTNQVDDTAKPYYGGIKSKLFSKDDNRVVSFDSLWERSFFIKMSKDSSVRSIRRKTERIKYYNITCQSYRTYEPDFLIEYMDGRKELIEIKPKSKINCDVISKKSSAEVWCRNNEIIYRMLTENDLKDLGVLDEYNRPVYMDPE